MNKENIHFASGGSLQRWNKTKNLHILQSGSNVFRNVGNIPNHTLGQNEVIKFGSPKIEKRTDLGYRAESLRNPQAETFDGYFLSLHTHTQSLIQHFEDLLSNQSEVTLDNRNQEVSWIFNQRQTLRLSEETLFHAVTYMDMYLQKKVVTQQDLPLLSTACLLISSKNNEIYQVKISKLLDIRKRVYSREDILDMESEIVLTLQFNLAVPSLYELYRGNEVHYQMCEDKYVTGRKEIIAKILSLCLQDQIMLEYGYNMSALAAICLFSKYRAFGNKSLSSELEGLRMKSPSLSRAYDRLSELVSDAKLHYRLPALSSRVLPINPESSTKFIQH